MSLSQLIANGLRRAHRMARKELHILGRFQQTKDSKEPDTRWGPEYSASCRYCGAYMTVYFDTEEALTEQGYDPEKETLLVSDTNNFRWERYMVVSGNWKTFPCGELKRRKS